MFPLTSSAFQFSAFRTIQDVKNGNFIIGHLTKEFLLFRYKSAETSEYSKISDDQNSGAEGLLNNTFKNTDEIENL